MAKDPELLRQAQEGYSTAFAVLVQTCRKRVYGTVYRLVGKTAEVEDVGQDVFLRLHTSLHQLRSVDVFDTWL